MRESVRKDSTAFKLSQLKHFLSKYLFFTKRFFSHFTFLFVSVLGTFPALPAIDTKDLITPETSSSQEVVSPLVYREELCRWQRDFSFFSDLEEEKATLKEAPPCIVPEQLLTTIQKEEKKTEKKESDQDLNTRIQELTSGYPLQIMAPTIAEYDRSVAALIVGIAKKESDWGKHVPRTPDGADCFNYWGFKGAGSRGVAMGHGCFGSPEEAVHAVGHRIIELVAKRMTSEPKNMVVWKCGSSCATHSPESVRKWIADVDLYYQKIQAE